VGYPAFKGEPPALRGFTPPSSRFKSQAPPIRRFELPSAREASLDFGILFRLSIYSSFYIISSLKGRVFGYNGQKFFERFREGRKSLFPCLPVAEGYKYAQALLCLPS